MQTNCKTSRLRRAALLSLPMIFFCVAGSAQAAAEGNERGPVVLNVEFATSYGTEPVRDKQPPRVSFWLESSLNRVFPTQKPGERHFSGISARNARFSFQACLRNDRPGPVDVECSVPAGEDLKVSVRRVGFVPQWNFTADVPPSDLDGWGHVPGLVPDPLYPQPRATVGPYAAQSFWITIEVPKDAKPGMRKLPVAFSSASWKEPVTLSAELEISQFVVQDRRNFPVTHWWNADAIYDWYKQPVFGEAWWKIMPAYLDNMLQHGSDVILVPLFYMRREIVQRPSQLLIINESSGGKYAFDWTRVQRFVDLAKKAGFKKFEWGHFWTYKVDATEASVDRPQRMYK
ncbi:MAG TPA: glycoside hydrolase domain-containing protein, partial [Clostridia bacterium]|nr:glycoside hydrolase domain-containing protein [Clostridia bacterium]